MGEKRNKTWQTQASRTCFHRTEFTLNSEYGGVQSSRLFGIQSKTYFEKQHQLDRFCFYAACHVGQSGTVRESGKILFLKKLSVFFCNRKRAVVDRYLVDPASSH